MYDATPIGLSAALAAAGGDASRLWYVQLGGVTKIQVVTFQAIEGEPAPQPGDAELGAPTGAALVGFRQLGQTTTLTVLDKLREWASAGDKGANSATVATLSGMIAPHAARYWATGYHAPGDGGGGLFWYDATGNRAEHNGGTIIDPTKTFPADWANAALTSAWFSAGAGSGVWRRQKVERLDIRYFGAIVGNHAARFGNRVAIKQAALVSVTAGLVGITQQGDLTVGALALMQNLPVYIPAGITHISGTNPLRPDLSAYPAYVNSKRRGLLFVGDGLDISILMLEKDPLGLEDVYFWSNEFDTAVDAGGRRRHGYDSVGFEHLSFYGDGWDSSVRNLQSSALRSTGSRINGFYQFSNGWEKHFNFYRCSFRGLDVIHTWRGASNADKNTCTLCQFEPFREAIVDCDNDQSVANAFVDCQYFGYGAVFRTVRGGGIECKGGSMVLYPRFGDDGKPLATQDERAIYAINAKASDARLDNRGTYIVVRDVTVETYSDSHKIVTMRRESGGLGGEAYALFDNVQWTTVVGWDSTGVVFPTTTFDAAILEGDVAWVLKFRDCIHDSRHKFRISNSGGTKQYVPSPVLSIRGAWANWAFTDGVTASGPISTDFDILPNKISVSGAASVTVGDVEYLQSTGSAIDRSYGQSSKIRTCYGFYTHPERESVRAFVKPVGRLWGTPAAPYRLRIPEKAVVQRVEFVRRAIVGADVTTINLTNGRPEGSGRIVYKSWTLAGNQEHVIDAVVSDIAHDGVLGAEISSDQSYGVYSSADYLAVIYV